VPTGQRVGGKRATPILPPKAEGKAYVVISKKGGDKRKTQRKKAVKRRRKQVGCPKEQKTSAVKTEAGGPRKGKGEKRGGLGKPRPPKRKLNAKWLLKISQKKRGRD